MNKIIAQNQEENLNIFSSKGIIKRKTCFIYTLFLLITNSITKHLWEYAFNNNLLFLQGVIFTIILLIIYSSIITAIKRLKDIGWYKWISIFAILPIFLLVISLIPTKDKDKSVQKFNLLNFKESLYNMSSTIFIIGYIIVGFIQWVATYAGVYSFINNTFFSILIAGFIAYIPILGTITGIYGAYKYWGFPLWCAILLFCINYIIAIIIAIIQFIIEKLLKKFQS